MRQLSFDCPDDPLYDCKSKRLLRSTFLCLIEGYVFHCVPVSFMLGLIFILGTLPLKEIQHSYSSNIWVKYRSNASHLQRSVGYRRYHDWSRFWYWYSVVGTIGIL